MTNFGTIGKVVAMAWLRMSHDTFEDNDTNNNYLEEDVGIDDLVIPPSNVDNLAGDVDSDGGKGAAKPLQVQMAELEVELLTAKRALLQTHSAQRVQPSANAIVARDATLRSYASEQWSRRCRIAKQQQDKVIVREQRVKKMYTVDVDMKGNPCGKTNPCGRFV